MEPFFHFNALLCSVWRRFRIHHVAEPDLHTVAAVFCWAFLPVPPHPPLCCWPFISLLSSCSPRRAHTRARMRTLTRSYLVRLGLCFPRRSRAMCEGVSGVSDGTDWNHHNNWSLSDFAPTLWTQKSEVTVPNKTGTPFRGQTKVTTHRYDVEEKPVSRAACLTFAKQTTHTIATNNRLVYISTVGACNFQHVLTFKWSSLTAKCVTWGKSMKKPLWWK